MSEDQKPAEAEKEVEGENAAPETEKQEGGEDEAEKTEGDKVADPADQPAAHSAE